jgi:hypothetical protein
MPKLSAEELLFKKHPPTSHCGVRPFHSLSKAHQKTLLSVMDSGCMEVVRVVIDYAMSSWKPTLESQAQLLYMEECGEKQISDAATALLRVHAERRLVNIRKRNAQAS